MDADEVGIVVIGRNEGDRLVRCLNSIHGFAARVYVDSGSTDGSQELARSLGFHVLDLDSAQEFTAARARNLGIFFIADNYPQVSLIQTVDGDCELTPGWTEQAQRRLASDPALAVVFGRRRERFPDRNLYHRACDAEWNVPVGPAASSGGDALFRLSALKEVGGFNPDLISWEEPDLCFRLRRADWRIYSDGQDMTVHDVDISSLRQWWRRALRAGLGIAALASLHGLSADKGWRRFLLRGFFWAALLVSALIALVLGLLLQSPVLLVAGLLILAVMALQVVRTAIRSRSKFRSFGAALQWSSLLLASKVAEAQGACVYWFRRLTSSRMAIVEYK